jgi:hypothetical protein
VPTERHVEASRVGELVCLDCFYVGNLKGVGKVLSGDVIPLA